MEHPTRCFSGHVGAVSPPRSESSRPAAAWSTMIRNPSWCGVARTSHPVALTIASSELARVGDRPAALDTAPAAIAGDGGLAGLEQRRARAAIRAVGHSRGPAELVGRSILDDAVLVGERRQHSEQHPCGAAGAAATEDGLEQFDVDVAFPPRAGLREQQPKRACLSAEPVACLEERAGAHPRTRCGDARAGPRQLVTVGIARQRERRQPLAGRHGRTGEHGGDRGVTQPATSGDRSRSPPRLKLTVPARNTWSRISRKFLCPQKLPIRIAEP